MTPKSLWLARLLYRHDGLTKQDILEAWREEDDCGKPMAASTFYDNRRYLEQRYGLRIECHGGRYALSHEHAPDDALLRHLLGEPRTSGLGPDETAGAHWIPLLADSIEWNGRLRMEYAPPGKPPYETFFDPYCLRRVQGCYYVVGRSSRHNAVRNFAADRINGLTALPMRFRRAADFRADDWFAHSFGAFGGTDLQPEHVVLAVATARMADYLRTRPLHPSQHEATAGGDVCFELDIAPTRDFIGQLLAFGADISVLAPQSLRDRLRREIAEMLSRY